MYVACTWVEVKNSVLLSQKLCYIESIPPRDTSPGHSVTEGRVVVLRSQAGLLTR